MNRLQLRYLVNEDGGDEEGKVLFGEARDVAHEGRSVDGDEDDEDQADPHADPQSQRQIVQVEFSATTTNNNPNGYYGGAVEC